MDRDLNPDGFEFLEKDVRRNFLDVLMEEIPGKNNYGGRMEDGGFDAKVLDFDGKGPLDVSRYHRWFKLENKDAMGQQQSNRGFADSYMFAAKTTQDRVSGLKMKVCKRFRENGKRKKVCIDRYEKWSYAIPLEIIYLTPLSKWNPYGIKYQPSCSNQLNTNDERNGTGVCKTMSKAKKFACDRFYYLTPSSFFTGAAGESDPADTAKNAFCLLDKDGNGVSVAPSGTRIKIPMIEGVGSVRQRFPISPIHGQGSSAWKKLDALTDMFMHNASYHFMKVNPKAGGDQPMFTYQLGTSRASGITPHVHFFTLSGSQVSYIMKRKWKQITVETDTRESHSHTLQIRFNPNLGYIEYVKCTGRRICLDEHPKKIDRFYE